MLVEKALLYSMGLPIGYKKLFHSVQKEFYTTMGVNPLSITEPVIPTETREEETIVGREHNNHPNPVKTDPGRAES